MDYGLYVGGTADNSEEVKCISANTAGLKLYLNDTFTTLKMDNISDWIKVMDFLLMLFEPFTDINASKAEIKRNQKIFFNFIK